MTPAIAQESKAAVPTAWAANSEPNSQPEPMIDVSDDQMAPIEPHLSLEADVSRSHSGSRDRLCCHDRTFFPVRIRGPYVGHTPDE